MDDREAHDLEAHDPAACARAWQTLRMAHDRVADRLSAELGEACGLLLSEFDVLLYVKTHPSVPVTIGSLRDAVSLSQPALSRLVARLEGRGLLTRSGAAHDARASLIALTPAGTDVIERAIAIQAETVQQVLLGKMSDEEQAALLRVLSRITIE